MLLRPALVTQRTTNWGFLNAAGVRAHQPLRAAGVGKAERTVPPSNCTVITSSTEELIAKP